MKTVKEHYDSHLGPVYSWMVGDIDTAFKHSDAELDIIKLSSMVTDKAVDLGAGFGLHALPLARRGFAVIAIDTCETLLNELEARTGSLDIQTINADLLDFRAHIDSQVDVILCMGDTLTHLPDESTVESFFDNVAASLVEGGVFMATFRDYVSSPLQADARFIPVRSDQHRILTCFLEYHENTVMVHDLLHEREGAQWHLSISSYPKLRLAPEWVHQALSARGFSVNREMTQNGMVKVVAYHGR